MKHFSCKIDMIYHANCENGILESDLSIELIEDDHFEHAFDGLVHISSVSLVSILQDHDVRIIGDSTHPFLFKKT